MRDDLKSLRITHKELRDLTNLPVDNQLPSYNRFPLPVGEVITGKSPGF